MTGRCCFSRRSPSRRNRFGLRFLLAALLLGGLFGGGASAAEPHAILRDFQPSGRFILVLEGNVLDKTRFFHARRAGAWLIVTPGRSDALILRTGGERIVETVSLTALLPRDDGGRDLRADAELTRVGTFRFMNADIVLDVPDFPALLRPRPWLLGWKTAGELLEHTPEYGRDAVSFQSNKEALQSLRAMFEGKEIAVEVHVYFGSWCPTCNEFLGRIINLEQTLRKATFRYYGLPNAPEMWQDAEVQAHQIRKLPVGIVYVNQQAVGRIVQRDWALPAIALNTILRSVIH